MQNRRNGSSLIKVYAPVYTCIYLCHAAERRTLNELLATSWPRREQLAASVVHSTVNVGNVRTIQTFISLSRSLSSLLFRSSYYRYTHIQGEAIIKYAVENQALYTVCIPVPNKRVTKCGELLTRYVLPPSF